MRHPAVLIVMFAMAIAAGGCDRRQQSGSMPDGSDTGAKDAPRGDGAAVDLGAPSPDAKVGLPDGGAGGSGGAGGGGGADGAAVDLDAPSSDASLSERPDPDPEAGAPQGGAGGSGGAAGTGGIDGGAADSGPDSTVASGAVAVTAGYHHSCALGSDGKVTCWAYDAAAYGETSPPASVFQQVSAGYFVTCGIRGDGTVACWGYNAYGEANPPAGPFRQISGSAAGAHFCGTRVDGSAACWGYPAGGRTNPPPGEFRQVVAGGDHSCGLRNTGAVECWGDNSRGQGQPPLAGEAFTEIAAGGLHTCGLKTDGTVRCWGDNGNGQTVAPAGSFTQIAAGAYHSCGLRADGTATCWGAGGDQRTSAPAGVFVQVAAGGWHSCAVTRDRVVQCWGFRAGGPRQEIPPVFTAITAGQFHTCAMRSDGTVACWGDNTFGQAVAPPGTFLQVAAGGFHSCALGRDFVPLCWGDNGFGQLDQPQVSNQISAGRSHTCGLRADGTAVCWGNNDFGKSVPPAGTFTRISAGGGHTCALSAAGAATCWGNDYGAGSPPTDAFAQISAGRSSTCALRLDGTVACWGNDDYGQSQPLGGTFSQVSTGEQHACGLTPEGAIRCWGGNASGQAAPPPGPFTQVAAGGGHTCALRPDGQVACWGLLCTPGELSCQGSTPALCDDVARVWQAGMPCVAPSVCADGICTCFGAGCPPCTPGDRRCRADGVTPEQCDIGGAWIAGGACVGQTCVRGDCRAGCSPGARRCRADNITPEVCNALGTWAPESACVNRACVDGTCQGTCAPGARRCQTDNVTPEMCSVLGDWVAATPCAGQTCVAGICQGTCAPGGSRCDAGVLQQCTNGAWTTREVCPTGCLDETSCACSPGQAARCLGNTPRICTVGGFWEDAESCSTCMGAGRCCHTECQILSCDILLGCTCTGPFTVCTDPTPRCTPGQRRCNQRAVEECDASRTWRAVETCAYVCSGQGVCSGECIPNATRCKPGAADVRQSCDSTGAWVDQPACTYACVSGSCGGVCRPGTGRCKDALTRQICGTAGAYDAGTPCPNGCFAGACSDAPGPCSGPSCGVLYQEHFDAACPPQDWTLAQDWQCGAPSVVGPGAALSGTNVIATGIASNYSNNQTYADTVAQTPPIDLGTAGQPVLVFWAYVETEASFDGFNVKVSSDGGVTFTPVTAVDPIYGPSIGGEPAWAGRQQALGYQQFMADLSQYAGRQIVVRFSFRSDTIDTYPGVYIDDVSVVEAALIPATVVSAAVPRCTAGQTRCAGQLAQLCGASQVWQTVDECPFLCSANGVCTGVCVPGSSRCEPGTTSGRQVCNAAAQWVDQAACGGSCSSGACAGVYLDESFDVLCPPAGWGLTQDWECGPPSVVGPVTARSGSNVIATGIAANYSGGQTFAGTVAETPSIDLRSAVQPVLRFWAYVDTEGSTYDGFNLKVSTDGGQQWSLLTPIAPDYSLTIAGEQAWGGHQQALGYQPFTADLSGYVGERILLRFGFRSDTTASYPGVYVDDVSVTEAAAIPLAITSTSISNAQAGVSFAALVTKTGGSAGSVFSVAGGTNIAWLTIDSMTGRLSGVPSAADAGPTSVTVRVSEPSAPWNTAEATFTFRVVVSIFYESFESVCPGGWTLAGDWECGTPSAVGPPAAFTGAQCIATQIDAIYSNNQTFEAATATSPLIDLTAALSPKLTFRMWLQTEAGFDGVNLKVGIEGANYALASAVTPVYDRTIAGEQVWSGDKTALGWASYVVDLAAFAGKRINLRFAFRSDSVVGFPGAYIDDLTVAD